MFFSHAQPHIFSCVHIWRARLHRHARHSHSGNACTCGPRCCQSSPRRCAQLLHVLGMASTWKQHRGCHSVKSLQNAQTWKWNESMDSVSQCTSVPQAQGSTNPLRGAVHSVPILQRSYPIHGLPHSEAPARRVFSGRVEPCAFLRLLRALACLSASVAAREA